MLAFTRNKQGAVHPRKPAVEPASQDYHPPPPIPPKADLRGKAKTFIVVPHEKEKSVRAGKGAWARLETAQTVLLESWKEELKTAKKNGYPQERRGACGPLTNFEDTFGTATKWVGSC